MMVIILANLRLPVLENLDGSDYFLILFISVVVIFFLIGLLLGLIIDTRKSVSKEKPLLKKDDVSKRPKKIDLPDETVANPIDLAQEQINIKPVYQGQHHRRHHHRKF